MSRHGWGLAFVITCVAVAGCGGTTDAAPGDLTGAAGAGAGGTAGDGAGSSGGGKAQGGATNSGGTTGVVVTSIGDLADVAFEVVLVAVTENGTRREVANAERRLWKFVTVPCSAAACSDRLTIWGKGEEPQELTREADGFIGSVCFERNPDKTCKVRGQSVFKFRDLNGDGRPDAVELTSSVEEPSKPGVSAAVEEWLGSSYEPDALSGIIPSPELLVLFPPMSLDTACADESGKKVTARQEVQHGYVTALHFDGADPTVSFKYRCTGRPIGGAQQAGWVNYVAPWVPDGFEGSTVPEVSPPHYLCAGPEPEFTPIAGKRSLWIGRGSAVEIPLAAPPGSSKLKLDVVVSGGTNYSEDPGLISLSGDDGTQTAKLALPDWVDPTPVQTVTFPLTGTGTRYTLSMHGECIEGEFSSMLEFWIDNVRFE